MAYFKGLGGWPHANSALPAAVAWHLEDLQYGFVIQRLQQKRSPEEAVLINNEIELKLEVDRAGIDMLVAASIFANAASDSMQTSTYFDTPGQAVRNAGLSLRIRASGSRRIQTVKFESASAAGLFARPEWEIPIEGDLPVFDGTGNPIRSVVPAHELLRLEPIFQIVVNRQIREIAQNGAKIELVLDQGKIVAGYHTLLLCEIELELKEGSPAAMFELARALDAVAPLQLSPMSKAQLGYRLLEGGGDQPVTSTPMSLRGEMALSEGFAVIAQACVRQFRLNQSILTRTGSPEALHQARVALRRLRSAMSIFKDMLADARFEYFLVSLRWIARELDKARNLDVLLRRLPNAAHSVTLRLAREHAYATVMDALVSARLRMLMIDFVEWIVIGNWRTGCVATIVDQRIDSFASKALDRCHRRVKRRGRHWGKLDDETRHRLRIQVKKLRYASEFFCALFPATKALDRQKEFFKALRALQTSLGALNDQATGAALLAELGLSEVIIGTMAKEQAQNRSSMMEDASQAYDTLVNAKRFWR